MIEVIEDWWKREKVADQTDVAEYMPDLMTCRTILYVGVRPEGWGGTPSPNDCELWMREIATRGYVHGLEAWWKYCERLNTREGRPRWMQHLHQGDICHFQIDWGYELVIWWHGPEHAPGPEDGLRALQNCESIATRYVLLCTPWGPSQNALNPGFEGDPDNPLEGHGWELKPAELDKLGYDVFCLNCNDKGHNPQKPCGHILAVKGVNE